MTDKKTLFSRRDLIYLIVPLIIEQILAVTIGMADTIMVTSVGEAAVSGISIVDSINILLINIFVALASGGAIVTAQYLGREDNQQAKLSANQLLFSTTAMSLVIMLVCLLLRNQMLDLLFGNVDSAVMTNARAYFFWSALSYPFLALYNGGAALFRVMGNSKVSMFCALLMNLINIGGNAILIYGFGMGVTGAAIASLVSRAVGAFIVTRLLLKPGCPVQLDATVLRPHKAMIGRIMSLGIPNGIENGMFQIGKILVQGVVAGMGTVALAANAVANSIGGVPNIAGNAIGIAIVTVVGQCMGAGRKEEARGYILKLLGVAYMLMGIMNLLLLAVVGPLVGVFHLGAQTTALATEILVFYAIASIFIWPPAFMLPNGLRAAGDARYTLVVSTISMWVFRIGGCYFFCFVLGMGVNGTWFAMYTDWAARAICFLVRFFRGKWQHKQVIEG